MNYNPKPFENLLKRYLLRQAAEIDKLIDKYIRQLVLQSTRVNPQEDTEFEFRNYPSLSRAVDRTLRTMSNSITGTIQSGIEWAWDLANAKNDDMVARIVRSIGASRIPQGAIERWNQKNLPALEAFQQRKFSGMSLSDRVWDYSRGIKGDLELSIDLALGEGMSADRLAQRVKGYLKEPDRLYRRVRDEKGILRLSKAASNYHPGQGVYRSSYKNAKRLAGTETNIAYRSADYERNQQLDFILGIEVHLSKNHTCLNAKGEPEPFYDICDELQGRYPKDFKFVGWHPNCYDDKSEVYTSNGWKPFADVNEHDHILTLNPDTLDLEYTDYKMKFASWYEGEMTHFHNRSYSQLVTPDHEVLCLNKNSREPIFKRITARKCGKSQPVYRSSRWNGKYINSIQIGSLNVDFCRFCEFMGYWLSDGSLGHKWEVGIAQQDIHREAIFDCISALGMRPRYNGGKVEFNSEDWYKYLEPFGKCADKFVPAEIKEATPEQIKVFLDAFISCDGYIRPPKSFVGSHGNMCESKESERTYFTTSKRLADDIGELILKIGERPSFKLNKAAGRKQRFHNGEYIINYDCWIISECRSVTATQYNKDVVNYKGWVYDLVLEKNATMYIRREGKCFWGSNCRCYTTTILPSEDEFFAYLDEMDDNGNSTYRFKDEITDIPANFKKWMNENQNRIALAEQRGNLPYFIRDNRALIIDRVNLNSDYVYVPMTTKDLQYLVSQGIIEQGNIPFYENIMSDKFRQELISRFVDSRAGFDIDSYAKTYGEKNPEVAKLYKEIELLKGKDEVLRLRKINKLKMMCGNLSAKEIQKWGLISGLEYIGIDKGAILSSENSYNVNGKTIRIKEIRVDFLKFRSSDSNVVLCYPLGMRKADAVYDIGEASKFVNGMPTYLTNEISSIRFIARRNPFDKYWAACYKMPRFESYATDGEEITFWRRTKENRPFFQYALTHEASHIFDSSNGVTKSMEWRKAIEADIELYKSGKIGSEFPTEYAKQTYNASDDIKEDFAESLSVKLRYDAEYGPKWFARLFPNRAKLLDEILSRLSKGATR